MSSIMVMGVVDMLIRLW